MFAYIVRRILMMVPTLFGITLLCFLIINLAPGSPIDQKLQQIRMGGALGGNSLGSSARSETGVSDEVLQALKKQYGFDKPVLERYWIWISNVAKLDFGRSFKYEEPVTDVILSKMPVSLLFGITSLILTYLVCVPLGIAKALKSGSQFDFWSSTILFLMYSVPPLILGILLRTFLASETYFDWFPLASVHSDNYSSLDFWAKIADRVHHAVLPLTCYMIGSFTFLTVLMQNSMLDVIKLDYIRTARAKGLNERTVYFKHALRNALIPIATGLSGILSIMFAGSIVIENIFSLDGMGLLSLIAANSRDYNILMGLIFFQSVLFLFGRLLTDLIYVVIDPRIDFS